MHTRRCICVGIQLGCIMQTNGLANPSLAKRDSVVWGVGEKTYLKRDPLNRADRRRGYA